MLRSATLRRASLCAASFLFFSAGVENGVFLPSAIDYLHTIGVQREALLGIVVACYWLSVFASCRLLQILVGASYKTRLLLLLCCVLYILSGLLYYLAPSLWAVIFSKIFSGLGCGALSVVEAELALSTGADELASLRRRLRCSAAVGVLAAPVFSVASALLSCSTVPSEPGVVVAALFVLATLLTCLGLTDLARTVRLCRLRDTLALAYERKHNAPRTYGAIRLNETETSVDSSAESCSIIFSKELFPSPTSSAQVMGTCCQRQDECRRADPEGLLSQSDELLEAAEEFMGSTSTSRVPPPRVALVRAQGDPFKGSFTPSSPGDAFNEQDDKDLKVPNFWIGEKKVPAPCCNKSRTNWLCPQFMTGFLLGSLQTMLTPLTESYFLFSTTENSLAQLVLTVCCLLPFLLPRVSAHFHKHLLALGCLLGIIGSTGLLVLGPGAKDNIKTFAVCLMFLGLGCGTLGLTSGRRSREQLKLSQQQAQWLCCLGLVIGPLWTGSTVRQPKIMHFGHLVVLLSGFANCVL